MEDSKRATEFAGESSTSGGTTPPAEAGSIAIPTSTTTPPNIAVPIATNTVAPTPTITPLPLSQNFKGNLVIDWGGSKTTSTTNIGRYDIDEWTFTGIKGAAVTIEMISDAPDVDPFLTLLSPNLALEVRNDDGGSEDNAKIESHILSQDGLCPIQADAIFTGSCDYPPRLSGGIFAAPTPTITPTLTP